MRKKIKLREEVKARVVEEEEKKQIFNSPPSFAGRYLLCNANEKPILPADFQAVREKGWMHFWNAEFLEECDMFFEVVGWRLDSNAVNYLQNHGYVVEIQTLEQQKIAEEKMVAEEKTRMEKEAERKQQLTDMFNTKTAEIDRLIAQLHFHQQGAGQFVNEDYIEGHGLIVRDEGTATIYNDRYIEYGLTKDRRVFRHNHINGDFWINECSDEKAPQRYIDIIKQHEKQIEAEREEAKQKRIHGLKNTMLDEYKCNKCDRLMYFSVNFVASMKGKPILCSKHGCNDANKLEKMNAVFAKTGKQMSQYDALEQELEMRIS